MVEQKVREFGGQHYLAAIVICAAVLSLPSTIPGTGWLYFFTPVPVVYYFTAFGQQSAFKIISYAALLAGLIVLALGSVQSLLLSLSLLPVGFVLARGLARGEDVYISFLKAVLAIIGVWVGFGYFIGLLNHFNLYSEIVKTIDLGLAGAYDNYRQMPNFPVESQVELQIIFDKMRVFVPKILPGVLAATAISIVWLDMTMVNWLLKKKAHASWPDYQEWRLPEQLVWPLISAGFFLFIPGWLNVLGLNVVLILLTLFHIQGISVILSLFNKWNVPNPVRFFIIFILIIQAYGIILLALLGVADIWVDFRKPKNVTIQ